MLAIYRAQAEALPLRLDTARAPSAFVAGLRRPVGVRASSSSSRRRTRPACRISAAAHAFVGRRGQGINYRRDVWHAPITALDADGDFLMLMWERGTAEDCIVHRLAEPLIIDGSTSHMTGPPMPLDLDFVRSQFPALADGFAYFDNAGGSLVLRARRGADLAIIS